VLEAADEWQRHRILFVTDNIPFEDYLRIYLLDAHWQIVDSAVLGAIYTTGAFSGLDSTAQCLALRVHWRNHLAAS